jgi:hypothetical protein
MREGVERERERERVKATPGSRSREPIDPSANCDLAQSRGLILPGVSPSVDACHE